MRIRSDITIPNVLGLHEKENTKTMAVSERVVFSFDPTSLETLNQVKEKGEFSSLGMAVRESLQLNDFFQNLVDKGFSEIVVRNPDTQQEKTIVISSLQKLANKKARGTVKK
jgi:hypothetical protein